MVKIWREVMSIDEETKMAANFSTGKIQVVTSCLETINQVIWLNCKGEKHMVRDVEQQPVIQSILQTQTLTANV